MPADMHRHAHEVTLMHEYIHQVNKLHITIKKQDKTNTHTHIHTHTHTHTHTHIPQAPNRATKSNFSVGESSYTDASMLLCAVGGLCAVAMTPPFERGELAGDSTASLSTTLSMS